MYYILCQPNDYLESNERIIYHINATDSCGKFFRDKVMLISYTIRYVLNGQHANNVILFLRYTYDVIIYVEVM